MNFYSEDSGNTTSFRELVCQNNLLNFRLLRVWMDTSVFGSGASYPRGPGGAAAPPDFENPKKLSHKNAIKLEYFEKWGKIGLLAPPDFWSSRGP